VCSSFNTKSWVVALPAALRETRGVTHTGRFADFQLFNSWRAVLPSAPWLCHYPAAQKQQGVKMRGAVILPETTVAGGRKNAQIYIIKREVQ
jgi:hypothetical protein